MLEELLAYVQADDRVCPQPQQWDALWEMLPDRRRIGGGWEPALPLILAAWSATPIPLKVLRLREHIEYAAARGVISDVDLFLRSLPESQWAHKSDFGVRVD